MIAAAWQTLFSLVDRMKDVAYPGAGLRAGSGMRECRLPLVFCCVMPLSVLAASPGVNDNLPRARPAGSTEKPVH